MAHQKIDRQDSLLRTTKFSFFRRIALLFLPRLIWIIIWGMYLFCRKHYSISQKLKATNFIAIFWHGEFLMLPFAYRKIAAERCIAVVASRHFHGEIVARVYQLFGFATIRGSSDHSGTNRGGVSALRQALQLLRDGNCVGLTPDGPKGPYHSISDGVIALSQKTQIPLVPFRAKYKPAYQFNSWDKFSIPLPLGKIEYHILDPIIISTQESIETAKQRVYQNMQIS